MKFTLIHKIVLLSLLCFVLDGCTEQYALQSNTFEDALVVEATITNELKKQEIKISRTFRFEDNGPTFETGAHVTVTDDLNTVYDFEEVDGTYLSTTEFQAQAGRSYRLNIITSNGTAYASTPEKLTTVNEIESVIPSVVTIDGDRGVQIDVNSYDPTGASKYYRYQYEEAYKIIAPKWDKNELIVVGEKQVALQEQTTETHTCYTEKKSDAILISSTAGLSEDRQHFAVRFISNQNYIITHRYTILVRRYVENLAAYTFYKTLKELSGTGSILSQNQPGFFYGNLKAVDHPDEKVIGFFDVATVSTRRIFFNYADLFPGESLPPYYNRCEELVLPFCFGVPPCAGNGIIQGVLSHTITYFYNEGLIYHMYEAPCGDCTTFSSNIRPAFWID